MRTKIAVQKLTVAFFLASLFLRYPPAAEAGCGCNKPPPAPAAVIPNVAFAGMPITLSYQSLQVGQTWTVAFQSGATTATVAAGVVWQRDLTDPSGRTYKPQLVVTVPDGLVGPTRIIASVGNTSFVILEQSFTVMAKPVVVSEQTTDYDVTNYTTAVGSDGTLYMSVGGLNAVCQAMKFKTLLPHYPLRFGNGDIVVLNSQGFLIDMLNATSVNRFSFTQEKQPKSNRLIYFRHSFAKYCADHLPGGPKEVDPADPNWHRDGTPHVDYSTLIFAIAGHFNDGSVPSAGSASFDLDMETILGDGTQPWEVEQAEEGVGHP